MYVAYLKFNPALVSLPRPERCVQLPQIWQLIAICSNVPDILLLRLPFYDLVIREEVWGVTFSAAPESTSTLIFLYFEYSAFGLPFKVQTGLQSRSYCVRQLNPFTISASSFLIFFPLVICFPPTDPILSGRNVRFARCRCPLPGSRMEAPKSSDALSSTGARVPT